MSDEKKRKAIRFLGRDIPFGVATTLVYTRTGADIRLEASREQWSATPNGKLDVAIGAFEYWEYADTPQAAASDLERHLHKKFRALAKALGYEVTG